MLQRILRGPFLIGVLAISALPTTAQANPLAASPAAPAGAVVLAGGAIAAGACYLSPECVAAVNRAWDAGERTLANASEVASAKVAAGMTALAAVITVGDDEIAHVIDGPKGVLS